ncbi:MAG: hypothetical protein EPN69_09560 [Rhodanobacter sp.]|nr:MAG: hypothetical protein EPN71_12435 [Rhodanobacter sp.]TAL91740.1 MAG: hypothetical protein EPN69_09560 [Rhodanobacter sp.]TAM42578.1 MAG: hypothetical protein EPN58_02885 [Rhodanobacter sp.]TAN26235.1 MAG: hypothetical protein EPN32_08085 [Rhodanobacter sp.]
MTELLIGRNDSTSISLDPPDLVVRLDMARITAKLCRGCLQPWPGEAQAPHYELLASHVLAEHADEHAEAVRRLDHLAAAWPEHPLRAEIELQRQRLAGLA